MHLKLLFTFGLKYMPFTKKTSTRNSAKKICWAYVKLQLRDIYILDSDLELQKSNRVLRLVS